LRQIQNYLIKQKKHLNRKFNDYLVDDRSSNLYMKVVDA